MNQHLFGDPVAESDINFSHQIDVNVVDPEEADSIYADFFGTDRPKKVCQRFAGSKSGETVLQKLGKVKE